MTSPSVVHKRGGLSRLYHGETRIDFIGRWKLWFAISGAIILIGLGALAFRGLNLGIEFEGGNVWETPAGKATVSQVERAMGKLNLGEVRVQEVTNTTGTDRRRFRVQAATIKGSDQVQQAKKAKVISELSRLTGTPVDNITANEVGASWGQQISEKARNALVVFLIAITIYITLRFEFKMAVATLAALIHDLLVVIGIYALVGFPVTPATVIAILTILGFSIYDGIVVFDRVDENTKMLSASGRITYSEMTNLSLNQVLMRSLNTSITAVLPILSILIVGAWWLGAEALEDFGLALFIGLLSGAYSSIFIASPVLALLKEREPRYRALRKRIAERAGSGPTGRAAVEEALEAGAVREGATVGVGTDSNGGGGGSTATGPAAAGRTYSANHPPRPRKKGKKR